jgi:hypothetical protein
VIRWGTSKRAGDVPQRGLGVIERERDGHGDGQSTITVPQPIVRSESCPTAGCKSHKHP